MKAVIKIQMDNAAFDPECPGLELARILRELADKVGINLVSEYDRKLTIRDINGNTVGELKVSK